MSRLYLVVLLAPLVGCGTSEPDSVHLVSAQPATRSALALHGRDDAIEIEYIRGGHATGPRVVELFIRHSENLSFESVTPGEGATAAGKEVIVQAKDARTLRVLLFSSSSTKSLDSGTLATIHLDRNPGKARAEILLDTPLFAPQSAQDGLTVSDPVDF